MEINQKPGKLGNPGNYIIKAMSFFGLKDERLTPVIFSVILFVSLLTSFVPEPESKTDPVYFAIQALAIIITNLAAAIYLLASIKEFKGEEYSLADCTAQVLRSSFKIIIASILYIAAVIGGFVLVIIPGIVISLMFMFNICYIVDKNTGAIEAFKASRNVAIGKKRSIFSIILVFSLLLILPFSITMVITTSSTSSMVQSFVLSFLLAIANLMQERLVALIYIDLEYGKNDNENNDN